MDAPVVDVRQEDVVDIRQEENVTVVKVIWNQLRHDPEVRAFGEALCDLTRECQQPRIVFDFTVVNFLSAIALGRLITLDGAIKRADGQLRLCSIRPEVLEIFWITKLSKLFKIDDNLEESLVKLS